MKHWKALEGKQWTWKRRETHYTDNWGHQGSKLKTCTRKKLNDRKQNYGPGIIEDSSLKNERSDYVLGKRYPDYSKQRRIKVKPVDLNSAQRAICWYKQKISSGL